MQITSSLRLFCVISLAIIISEVHSQSSSIVPDREAVRLRILEFDKASDKLVQVWTSRDSDLVFGEDVGETSYIVLECRSNYGPITVSYKGDGAPEFTTSTNTTRTSHGTYFWTFLSFPYSPRAEDSGNYSCISPSLRNSFANSIYLFVPDSALFTPSRLENRVESPQGRYFRIPCSVLHPSVRVTLDRISDNSGSESIHNGIGQGRVTYDPKYGFDIPLSLVHPNDNGKGPTVFVCKAYFRGRQEEVEYKIYSEYYPGSSNKRTMTMYGPTGVNNKIRLFSPPSSSSREVSGIRSACSPRTCGKSAECIVIDYAAHCVCNEFHSGDPFTECRRMSDRLQTYTSADPCSPNPCGRGNPCVPINGHPVCTCEGNHLGSHNPTVCDRRPHAIQNINFCSVDTDCLWNQRCHKESRSCENVCSNGTRQYCGENARCVESSNHFALCQCLEGHGGNPYNGCRRIGGQSCPNGRCNSNVHLEGGSRDRLKQLCNYTSCGVGAKCRVIKDRVDCSCPNGTKGNPYVRCESDNLNPQDVSTRLCRDCGPNSRCTVSEDGSKIRCDCAPNAVGQPPNCAVRQSQQICRDNFDCLDNMICDQRRGCVDPCNIACSDTAICTVSNHIPSCKCPHGFEGDPKFGCRQKTFTSVTDSRLDEDLDLVDHPCRINCGPNTVCRAVMLSELDDYRNTLRKKRQESLYFDMIRANGNLKQGMFSECLCRKGFQGNPYGLSGCKEQGYAYKAEATTEHFLTIVMDPDPCDPSPCGSNSFCRRYKGKAFCSCDFDSVGQPPNCKHKCQFGSHCMFDEVCNNGLCEKDGRQDTNNNANGRTKYA